MASSVCTDQTFGPTVTGCRGDFDFTLYFEQSTLSLVPSAILLCLTPFRILQLYMSPVKTAANNNGILKSVSAYVRVRKQRSDNGLQLTASILAILDLTLLILWSTDPAERTKATVPCAVLDFVASLSVLALSNVEHSRSVKPSFLLNVYLFISFILDLAQARTLHLLHEVTPIASVYSAIMLVKLVLLLLEAQSKHGYLQSPYKKLPPESTSGIFNESVFWWLNPLLFAGARNILSHKSLFGIDTDLMAGPLEKKLSNAWSRRSKPETRFSLPIASTRALKLPLLLVVFPRLCLIGFSYAQPFLITRVINYISQTGTAVLQHDEGYGLIAATALIYIGIAVSIAHYQHRVYRCMTMFRGGMTAMIYNRTLVLQDNIYAESSAVTLMGTDVDQIVKAIQQVNECWAQLLQVIIGVYLLSRQVGWIAVMPLVIVGLCIAGNSQIAKLIGGRQKVWADAVQKRIAITSSALGNMKAVKMLGLSDMIFTVIQGHRVRELRLQASFRWLQLWMNIFANTPGPIVPAAVFTIFTIQAKIQGTSPLTASTAFTSLALISLVTSPAGLLLAAVPTVAASLGCFIRIQNYLLAPIRDDGRLGYGHTRRSSNPVEITQYGTFVELDTLDNVSPSKQCLIQIVGADIRPAPSCDLALRDINIDVNRGACVMVLGPTGCGKTTLLRAILGEVPVIKGTIKSSSKHTAFCAQTPWLVNCSIRQSICGLSDDLTTIDEQWYKTVLHACVLDKDIGQLPNGDQSVIGSRGLMLSGGQRQRLGVARAVYSREKIFVMDDVLSALDSKTEDLFIERLLGPQGLLRKLEATIILATHSTRHLDLSDSIVVLEASGRITQQGSYEDLKTQSGYIRAILSHSRRPAVSEDESSISATRPWQISNSHGDPTMDQIRKTGDLAVYNYYAKSIGWINIGTFMTSCALNVFCTVFSQVWLSWWSSNGGGETGKYVAIYIVLAIGTLFFNGVYMWLNLIIIAPKSAAKLHLILLNTVIRAPLSFFLSTDTGSVVNRFSQDMTLVSRDLPVAAMITTKSLWLAMGQICLISSGSTYMALTIPLVLFTIYVLQNFYLRTSRQLRYLDLEAKVPIYSHFLETLEGVSSIRAFGWEEQAKTIHLKHLNTSQRPYYLLFCVQRWLNLVMDLIVAALAVIVIALAINLRNDTSPGLLGIALNNILSFNLTMTTLVNYYTEVETSLGAIARLKSFESQTTPESLPNETFLPVSKWPEKGAIEFQEMTASYGQDAIALHKISICIQPGQKIGICGRTGSGKSSLLSALLRLIEIDSGRIIIDNIDISTIPRSLLRQRIIVIPQDSFILTGSVRLNIDPMSLLSDAEIVIVLEKIDLWSTIEKRGGLDVDLAAEPLSQGQQQLLALGRAITRKENSRILLLDEATSSVDAATDQVMQRVIREEFKDHTVITVAHRLETLLTSDVIAVLEGGSIVEFDTPSILRESGAFKAFYRD